VKFLLVFFAFYEPINYIDYDSFVDCEKARERIETPWYITSRCEKI
jgi:hypothetical protein